MRKITVFVLLILTGGIAGAAEKSAPTAGAAVPLVILPAPDAPWNASLNDVKKVLYSAAGELWRYFPGRTLPTIEVEPKGGPITLYKRGPNGEIRVRLNTGSTYWAQYSFQFAHELCHILCNYKEGRHPNKWFEESLCELASLFALRGMAKTWQTDPPYPNWGSFSVSLGQYAENRMSTARLPAGKTLAAWYRENVAALSKDATLRDRNNVVATALLPLFEKDPAKWAAVSYLNTGKTAPEQTFAAYLGNWHRSCPPDHRRFVEQIAGRFDLTLAGAKPVELGVIDWERDYETATRASWQQGKPILLLFQEIPGCATCRNFGCGPLSDPFVVDAARAFVPLAIYNNRKGDDLTILKRYGEPAWNNPVVRFVSADGKDLIPRKDRVWSTPGLLPRMAKALEAAGKSIPGYLSLVAFELNPRTPQKAVFAMHCYWVGEKELGGLDGVLATAIGSLQRKEVVEVAFDASVISYEKLLETALKVKCAGTVFARTAEQAQTAEKIVGKQRVVRTDEKIDTKTQQQYHLAHYPHYHYLPLTPLQASRVNAALARRQSPDGYLSPSQLMLRNRLAKVVKGDKEKLRRLKKAIKAERLLASMQEQFDSIEKVLGEFEDGY